jgi:hypothetical protein
MQNTIPALHLRLKDKHAGELRENACAVNFLRNYCNELSMTGRERERRFISGYDSHPLIRRAKPGSTCARAPSRQPSQYAARRGCRMHVAAAGAIARRRQRLTESLPLTGTAIGVPVRGDHRALELHVRKNGDSRVAARRDVLPAYIGVVRGQWPVTRRG